MEITTKEITEYSFCPKLYFFKNSFKLTPSLEEYYNDTLHRLMHRFLFMARDGEVSAKELKMIWASSAIVQRRKSKFAYYSPATWKSSISEFNKKGVAAINFLLNTYPSLLGSVIAINEPYRVILSKDIEIAGKWDLIQENKGTKEIELIIFKEHDKLAHVPPTQDYKAVIDTLAFREKFNITEGATVLQSFNSEKKISAKIGSPHIKEAIDSVKNIHKAVTSGISFKYPSYRCKSCSAKLICRMNGVNGQQKA